MDGPWPSWPTMPASRSRVIFPIKGPVPLSLNEEFRFGTSVITAACIIGISVEPADRKR